MATVLPSEEEMLLSLREWLDGSVMIDEVLHANLAYLLESACGAWHGFSRYTC